MAPQKTRQWILENPPTKDVVLEGNDATFKLQEVELPELGKDQVLVKTLYLSNDPAQRGWIQRDVDPERLYVPPVAKGEIMRSFGVAEVIASNADSLKPGQLVNTLTGWAEYAVVHAAACRAIEPDEKAGLRATTFLGALGFTGLTAHYGLTKVAAAKAGETVVVSGAAGATGSMVVQIAKHIVGAKRVIGIAGGEKKCRWVESIGADVCVDYKSATFEQDLIKATDGFVEVYFDNVGGNILDLMLTRMKKFGRIAACGSIATYNDPGSEAHGIKNWFEVITNRLEIKGLIVLDAVEGGMTPTMSQEIVEQVKAGKIKVDANSETVVPTKFEDVPKTWTMLFKGGNQGKLVTDLTA